MRYKKICPVCRRNLLSEDQSHDAINAANNGHDNANVGDNDNLENAIRLDNLDDSFNNLNNNNNNDNNDNNNGGNDDGNEDNEENDEHRHNNNDGRARQRHLEPGGLLGFLLPFFPLDFQGISIEDQVQQVVEVLGNTVSVADIRRELLTTHSVSRTIARLLDSQ
ncbi:RNA binding protein [Reticulomyxa filosa]|uniref:RNA binding protein n=1 Tax=Reticulomyxa filosa TaxID=46433 RepID=X6LUB4_RETFI|nr:RNA binding protein [Reticulomyxa filosa]|eukprot:ETO04732.1 RNA binding protein [Reticulomyxa filosa]